MFVGNETMMVCTMEDDVVKFRTIDEAYELAKSGKTIMLQAYGNWKIAHIDRFEGKKLPAKGKMTEIRFARSKNIHHIDSEVLTERFGKISEVHSTEMTAREPIGTNPTTIWLKRSDFAWTYIEGYRRHSYRSYDHLYMIRVEPIKDEDRKISTFVPDAYIELSDGILVKADDVILTA